MPIRPRAAGSTNAVAVLIPEKIFFFNFSADSCGARVTKLFQFCCVYFYWKTIFMLKSGKRQLPSNPPLALSCLSTRARSSKFSRPSGIMGNCCFGSKKPIHEPIERHDADDELKQQVEAKHESDRHQQKVWITFQGPFVVNNSSQFIIKVKDPSRTSPEFELHQGCSFRIPEDAEVEIEIPREAMLGKI